MADITQIDFVDLTREQRWSAEYWRPQFLEPLSANLNWRPIGELLQTAQYGLSRAMNEEGTGVPCYRMNEMDGVFLGTPQKYIEVTEQEEELFRLEQSDVLFNRTNSLAFVGRTGFLAEDVRAVFASYLIRLKPIPDQLLPEYLTIYLNTSIGIDQVKRRAMESINQANVSASELKRVPIPLLPMRFQAELATLIQRAASKRRLAKVNMQEAQDALLRALALENLNLSGTNYYQSSFVEMNSATRFDAEYFSPRYQQALQILERDGTRLRDVADLKQRRFRPERLSPDTEFQYIEIGSVGQDGLTAAQTLLIADAPSRAQWIVKHDDVITSTVRPIRELSALIRPDQDGSVCSSGFAVLQAVRTVIEPELLLTFLRLPIVCEIMDLHTTASMYPAISTKRLMGLPISLPAPSVRREVVSKVRVALTAREMSAALVSEAKSELEGRLLAEM